MQFEFTPIPGLVILQPKVWEDDRGYFYESYNYNALLEAGIDTQFVQDNQSRSVRGVLRGLHYQTGDWQQAKLVRVVRGEVFDVAVDLRRDQATYGQWFGLVLSEQNKQQFFIPRGFAHGFLVLSETAEFLYKTDNYYSGSHEAGIRYDDPQLDINWDFPQNQLILSDKDQALPFFGHHHEIAGKP